MLDLGGASASGLLLALACPPYDHWYLAFVALLPLLSRVNGVSLARTITLGLVFGVTLHVLAQGWWIGLLERFTALSLLGRWGVAVVILAADAAKMASWILGSQLLATRCRIPPLVAFPAVLGVVEPLWPSLFDWHLGVALWRCWPLAQLAEIGGPAAVSSLLVLANLVVLGGIEGAMPQRKIALDTKAGVGLLVAISVAGLLRANFILGVENAATRVHVAVVQPNFGPLTPARRAREARHLVARLQDATRAASETGAELVLWPESAWPFFWDRLREHDFPEGHPWSLRERGSTTLIVGALTHPFGSADLFNSAVLLDKTGAITGFYDKRRLVPFAEFVPFAIEDPSWRATLSEALLERPAINRGSSDFVLLDGPMRIGVLMCSEDLQPGPGQLAVSQGANLLISMANDSWFPGEGPHYQHLALSSFRAIESRRVLLRATTNGVTAMFDATGRPSKLGQVTPLEPGSRGRPEIIEFRAPLLEAASFGWVIRYYSSGCLAALLIAFVLRNTSTTTR